MPVDPASQAPDALLAAKDRIAIGPVPPWVASVGFDQNVTAKAGDHVTHLFRSQQYHAERQQMHFHSAARLETMHAVEQGSQWRVEFDPSTQSVTVHWVKVRRGSIEADHASLDRFRVLQREQGLEFLTLHGYFTLLLLLEDVRPGDIVESCYTIESKPRLMPEHAQMLFSLPLGFSVGKFRFSIRFNKSRAMKWKAFSKDWKPMESSADDDLLWVWMGEKHIAVEPEPNTPIGHLGFPWVQFSDGANWQTISAAVCHAWLEQKEDSAVGELAGEIIAKEPETLKRVERAIQTIQDEFRYLSVNWDVGGHIPTAPGVVARRRYGDCKDLSFLLVHLLRRLGVSARPVLVNTELRKSVKEMLPTPWLFNHVIVEFEVEHERRWVDLTIRRQGGGALNRVVPDYGIGLAIDTANGSLVEPPRASVHSGVYEIKETLLLDTTGAPSILSVLVTATGFHAEWFRSQFENMAIADIAKERLQLCANRFGDAKRSGPMEHRDDRAENEFVIAEVFEVGRFLRASGQAGFCVLPFPPNLALALLPVPEKAARQTPFALPHPCNVVHIIQVESSALQPVPFKRGHVESPFVEFTRVHKHVYRHWSVTFAFSTLVEAVPADAIGEYRNTLEAIWRESSLELKVPVGYAHPRRRDDFGELPLPRLRPPTEAAESKAPPPRTTASEESGSPASATVVQETLPLLSIPAAPPGREPSLALEQPAPDGERARNHHRRRGQRPKAEVGFWLAGLSVVLLVLFFVIWMVKRASVSGTDSRAATARVSEADSTPIIVTTGGEDLQVSVQMAARLLAGTMVPRDVTGATNRLWRGVQRQHAPSITLLAELLLRGDLIPRDEAAALLWLRKSADLGHAPAQSLLADQAFKNSVGISIPEALRYYEMAAEQNWPRALAMLAFLYGEGKHVPRDDLRCRNLLERAATLEEPRAQFSLGLSLLNGQFGVTNLNEAEKLFRASAMQGFPPGQNAYGYQLARSDSMKRDIVEAWRWYELAAAGGDRNAIANMQTLRESMTAEQIGEARRRASMFKPRSAAIPSFMVLPHVSSSVPVAGP